MTTALDELSLRELYIRKEYLLKQIKRVDLEIEKKLYEEGEIEINNNINHDITQNITYDITQNITHDINKDKTQNITQDITQDNFVIKQEVDIQLKEETLVPKNIKISKKSINNKIIKDISTPISTSISSPISSFISSSTPKIMKITIKKSLVKEFS